MLQLALARVRAVALTALPCPVAGRLVITTVSAGAGGRVAGGRVAGGRVVRGRVVVVGAVVGALVVGVVVGALVVGVVVGALVVCGTVMGATWVAAAAVAAVRVVVGGGNAGTWMAAPITMPTTTPSAKVAAAMIHVCWYRGVEERGGRGGGGAPHPGGGWGRWGGGGWPHPGGGPCSGGGPSRAAVAVARGPPGMIVANRTISASGLLLSMATASWGTFGAWSSGQQRSQGDRCGYL